MEGKDRVTKPGDLFRSLHPTLCLLEYPRWRSENEFLILESCIFEWLLSEAVTKWGLPVFHLLQNKQ